MACDLRRKKNIAPHSRGIIDLHLWIYCFQTISSTSLSRHPLRNMLTNLSPSASENSRRYVVTTDLCGISQSIHSNYRINCLLYPPLASPVPSCRESIIQKYSFPTQALTGVTFRNPYTTTQLPPRITCAAAIPSLPPSSSTCITCAALLRINNSEKNRFPR